MDLNNIELPPSVIADLYHSSLIEQTEYPVNESAIDAEGHKDDKPGWKSLGNNQKNVLVIVNNQDAVYLPDAELSFLTGILGACNLNLADVAIVNLHNHPQVLYKELTTFFKSKIVFLFAVEPAAFGLPMSFPHYQIQAFAGNSFLYSPSLKELENDRGEKTKLWASLKRLFNL